MTAYRVPTALGLLVVVAMVAYGLDHYGPSSVSAYLFGGVVYGAVVAAVGSLVVFVRARRAQ